MSHSETARYMLFSHIHTHACSAIVSTMLEQTLTRLSDDTKMRRAPRLSSSSYESERSDRSSRSSRVNGPVSLSSAEFEPEFRDDQRIGRVRDRTRSGATGSSSAFAAAAAAQARRERPSIASIANKISATSSSLAASSRKADSSTTTAVADSSQPASASSSIVPSAAGYDEASAPSSKPGGEPGLGKLSKLEVATEMLQMGFANCDVRDIMFLATKNFASSMIREQPSWIPFFDEIVRQIIDRRWDSEMQYTPKTQNVMLAKRLVKVYAGSPMESKAFAAAARLLRSVAPSQRRISEADGHRAALMLWVGIRLPRTSATDEILTAVIHNISREKSDIYDHFSRGTRVYALFIVLESVPFVQRIADLRIQSDRVAPGSEGPTGVAAPLAVLNAIDLTLARFVATQGTKRTVFALAKLSRCVQLLEELVKADAAVQSWVSGASSPPAAVVQSSASSSLASPATDDASAAPSQATDAASASAAQPSVFTLDAATATAFRRKYAEAAILTAQEIADRAQLLLDGGRTLGKRDDVEDFESFTSHTAPVPALVEAALRQMLLDPSSSGEQKAQVFRRLKSTFEATVVALARARASASAANVTSGASRSSVFAYGPSAGAVAAPSKDRVQAARSAFQYGTAVVAGASVGKPTATVPAASPQRVVSTGSPFAYGSASSNAALPGHCASQMRAMDLLRQPFAFGASVSAWATPVIPSKEAPKQRNQAFAYGVQAPDDVSKQPKPYPKASQRYKSRTAPPLPATPPSKYASASPPAPSSSSASSTTSSSARVGATGAADNASTGVKVSRALNRSSDPDGVGRTKDAQLQASVEKVPAAAVATSATRSRPAPRAPKGKFQRNAPTHAVTTPATASAAVSNDTKQSDSTQPAASVSQPPAASAAAAAATAPVPLGARAETKGKYKSKKATSSKFSASAATSSSAAGSSSAKRPVTAPAAAAAESKPAAATAGGVSAPELPVGGVQSKLKAKKRTLKTKKPAFSAESPEPTSAAASSSKKRPGKPGKRPTAAAAVSPIVDVTAVPATTSGAAAGASAAP